MDKKALEICAKGMAYASLSTPDLASLYYKEAQYASKTSLPRDFMINTLLIRDYGDDTINDHIKQLTKQTFK
jgi:hypothetical protein